MPNTRKGIVSPYLRMLRFDSWIGWLFNFALGSILFAIPPINRLALLSFSFITATAGIFVLNQYFDREKDKLNLLKRNLPISSGSVSAKAAILVFSFLIILSISLVLLIDVHVSPLFITYLCLWICYSTPPFCLKSRPIVDIIVAGIGSGVLPFIIGLQVSHQLTLDFSLPWITRRYQDAFLVTIPLVLVQSSSHIFQAYEDYEADLRGNIHSFVTQYGKKTSLRVGKLMIVTSVLLPILYGLLNMSLTDFLHWYLLIFTCCVPFMFYVMNLLRTPSRDNISTLRNISRKASPVVLFVVWIYVYFIRISL